MDAVILVYLCFFVDYQIIEFYLSFLKLPDKISKLLAQTTILVIFCPTLRQTDRRTERHPVTLVHRIFFLVPVFLF